MRVVIPCWEERVSPIFDVARRLLVLDVDRRIAARRRYEVVPEEPPFERAARLGRLHADVVLCGAISRPLRDLLLGRGIQVVSRVCGPVDEVCTAFLSGNLNDAFRLPGAQHPPPPGKPETV